MCGVPVHAADEYLRNRVVGKDIITKYGFGFSHDSWDYILRRLGQKHGEKKLEMTGLAMPRKAIGQHPLIDRELVARLIDALEDCDRMAGGLLGQLLERQRRARPDGLHRREHRGRGGRGGPDRKA